MKKFALSLSLFILAFSNSSSLAALPVPEDSFNIINECIQNNDSKSCRDLFTASSMPLYNRFMSYGVMRCLPKDAEYVSEQNLGKAVVIRASFTEKDGEHFMRLVFVEEEEEWKLDVPESLRMAMGRNWQQQLDLVEKIYLNMRAEFKIKIDCKILRDMVRVKGRD